jgi:hypothetical protein
MGRDTKASDWQFAGILSLGASIGIAGGGWIFTFRSRQAAYQEDFIMLGAGIGTPGTTVEVSLPSFMEGDLSWSPISSRQPFSAEDLSGSKGTIGTYGASAGIGYSRLYASSEEWTKRIQKPLFGSTPKPPGSLFPEEVRSSFVNKPQITTGAIKIAPMISQVPAKPEAPNTHIYFRDQLNDGYGVLADVELERAARMAGDGLLETAGKMGKKFKPAVSIGAMGVVGAWFGIGSVVMHSMAAAGYVAVSVLSAGLVQAGEALLTGRGMNVMRAFATGYAKQLANMTAESPDMPNDLYNKLKYLDWKADLATYGQKHVDGGSRVPVSSLPEIGIAGEAAILQAVQRHMDHAWADSWLKIKNKHRNLYGESANGRANIYERALWKQVDQRKPVGFLASNDFLPS